MKNDSRWMKGTAPLALALVFVIAGCGGGKGSGAETTPQQKIAQLEASGVLPQLERLPILEGIDANRNGVRDDIETHIHRKYTDPEQRGAAMQTARAFQAMVLVDKNDAVALERVSEMGSRAILCAGAAFSGPEGVQERYQMAQEIKAVTTNTKQRLLAYLAYNKARSGSVSRMPKGDTCD